MNLIHSLTESARVHARMAVDQFDRQLDFRPEVTEVQRKLAAEAQSYHYGAITGIHGALLLLGADVPTDPNVWSVQLEHRAMTEAVEF